jgi:hypothetical protein
VVPVSRRAIRSVAAQYKWDALPVVVTRPGFDQTEIPKCGWSARNVAVALRDRFHRFEIRVAGAFTMPSDHYSQYLRPE